MSKHTPIGATFAPTLDERIASIIGEIAGHLTEATGIEPLWVP